MNYKYISDRKKENIIANRRLFHKYPELAWREFYTSYLISEKLKELGFDVYIGREFIKDKEKAGWEGIEEEKKALEIAVDNGLPMDIAGKMLYGNTGTVGVMKFKEEGPVCVLRFDIDGLNIEESDAKNHLPNKLGFASVNKGNMHACGHDGHIAIGLGIAEIISEHKDELKGEVRLIFQPAEEGCRGAISVCKSGFVDNADYIIGSHIGIVSEKADEIAVMDGGFLATSKIDAIFKGESVHASKWPEKGKNAILAAAEFAILSSNIASELNANINVGVIKGGSGRNVVADYAVCQCETRGETEEKNETAKKGLIISAKECSKKYGCDVELKYAGYGTNFSSDEFISGLGNKVASSMENIEYRYKKFTASEDFTNIAKFTEGFGTKCGYFTFGTELKAEHHTPNFDFDEEVLLKGTEFMFGLCRELLLEKGE